MANTVLAWSGAETGDFGLEANNAGGTVSAVTTGPSSGAREWKCNPTLTATGWISFAQFSATTGKQASINLASLFASFNYNPATLPAATNEICAQFSTGLTNTVVCTLRQLSSGVLAVYDSAGTLVATGTTVLTSNGGTHPGGKYRIDFSANRTTGAYQVNIEGVSELSGSGATFGATNIGNFSIGKVSNTNGNTVDFRYDDIWVDQTAFAPTSYAMVINKPTANGTTMSWTNSDSGVGDYSHVNTVPAQTTTFVQDPGSLSVPVIAQFAMQTFAQMGIPVGSTILGIVAMGYLKDGAAVIANTAKLGIISGVTKSTNSTAQNTSASFVNFGRLLQTDPNTGAAWTQSGIENMQYYVEEGTAGGSIITDLAAALITVVYTPAVTTTQTQLGKSRITVVTPQTQLGKARITVTAPQTQLGKSRIQVTVAQTMLGKANIATPTPQTLLGKSRITAITAQLQLGRARITAKTLQTQQGRSRIAIVTTQLQLGKARIALITTQVQLGKSRITVAALQTMLGKAKIALPITVRTILGQSRISHISQQTMTGKAFIVVPQATDNQDFTYPRPTAFIISPPIVSDVVGVRPR